MNNQEQSSTPSPERRPQGDEPAPDANLDETRARISRLQLIAREQIEKMAAQDAQKELEARRQRGGE